MPKTPEKAEIFFKKDSLTGPILEFFPDPIILTDEDLCILYVNKRAISLYGFNSDRSMVSRDAVSFIYPDKTSSDEKEAFAYRIRNGSVNILSFRYVREDGSHFWAEAEVSAITPGYGVPVTRMFIIRDVTERRQKVRMYLKESEEKYRVLSAQAAEGLIIAQGQPPRIIKANYAICRMLGYELSEIIAMPPSKVKMLIHSDDRSLFFERYKKRVVGENGIPKRYEIRAVAKDKSVRWLEVSSSRIDLHGRPSVQAVFVDITDRKKTEEKLASLNEELLASNRRLRQLALRDSHTGLYNHRYLGEIIETELSRSERHVKPLSVLMLDIDYFKSINDVYGHQFGDLILKQFAKLLRRNLRSYDTVARFGGEEFVVILEDTPRERAVSLAQRLLSDINVYLFGNKTHNIRLKISIGVSSYPDDKVIKGMDLVDLADKVLNKAKEDGGNRVYSTRDIDALQPAGAVGKTNHEGVKLLKNKLEKLNKRSNQSLVEAIFAFAKTIELKDQYTGEHVEKTVYFATEVARSLDLSTSDVEKIRQAAMLHDLGKIGISERILRKRSFLTKKEYSLIRMHPQIAVDILRPIQILHEIIPLIYYHHERWDGSGYPTGLAGNSIPIGARIIALADVYQALISDRPYRKRMCHEDALKVIRDGAGKQFDPMIVDKFLKILPKHPKFSL